MKYPELVPNWVCTTPIDLTIEGEGLTEDGAPTTVQVSDHLCNWQDGGQAEVGSDEKIVRVYGRAYFNGDICPSISNIVSGEAEIFGEKREIHRGYKRRNPDGTVNHTEIQFK